MFEPQPETRPGEFAPGTYPSAEMDQIWQSIRRRLDQAGLHQLIRRFARYGDGSDFYHELSAVAEAAAWECFWTWHEQEGSFIDQCLHDCERALRTAVREGYRNYDQRFKGPRRPRSLDATLSDTDDRTLHTTLPGTDDVATTALNWLVPPDKAEQERLNQRLEQLRSVVLPRLDPSEAALVHAALAGTSKPTTAVTKSDRNHSCRLRYRVAWKVAQLLGNDRVLHGLSYLHPHCWYYLQRAGWPEPPTEPPAGVDNRLWIGLDLRERAILAFCLGDGRSHSSVNERAHSFGLSNVTYGHYERQVRWKAALVDPALLSLSFYNTTRQPATVPSAQTGHIAPATWDELSETEARILRAYLDRRPTERCNRGVQAAKLGLPLSDYAVVWSCVRQVVYITCGRVLGSGSITTPSGKRPRRVPRSLWIRLTATEGRAVVHVLTCHHSTSGECAATLEAKASFFGYLSTIRAKANGRVTGLLMKELTWKAQRTRRKRLSTHRVRWLLDLVDYCDHHQDRINQLGFSTRECQLIDLFLTHPNWPPSAYREALGLSSRQYAKLIAEQLRHSAVRILGAAAVYSGVRFEQRADAPPSVPPDLWRTLTALEQRFLLVRCDQPKTTLAERCLALGLSLGHYHRVRQLVLAKARAVGCEVWLRSLNRLS